MKKLLFAFFLLFSVSLFAQFGTADSSLINPRVITEHQLTKDVAFDVTLLKLAQLCNSSNEVIQLKDKESGQIVVKPIFTVRFGLFDAVESDPIHYTLTITIKDYKIRYIITTDEQVSDMLEEEIAEYYTNLISDLSVAVTDYQDDGF